MSNLLFERVKLVADIKSNIDLGKKNSILAKYDLLASAITNEATINIINDNIANYNILMNEILFRTIMTMTNAAEFENFQNLNKMLKSQVSKTNEENISKPDAKTVSVNTPSVHGKVFKYLTSILNLAGGVPSENVSVQAIDSALQSFGLEVASDSVETEPESPVEIPDSINMNELFNDSEIPDGDIFNIGTENSETPENSETQGEADIDLEKELENTANALSEEPSETTETQGEADIDLEKELENAANALSEEPSETESTHEAEEVSSEEKEKQEEKLEEERKESLEKGDISGKADDIDKASSTDNAEIDEELDAYVDNIVNNIIKTYYNLCKPLFLNPPKGVMYTDESGKYNIMSIGKSEEKEGVRLHDIPSIRLFISTIYGAILNNIGGIKEAPKLGNDGMSISVNWMNPDGTMKYNYMPHIQVRNCLGVYRDSTTGKLRRAKTWSEFEPKLKKELRPTILALLKKVDVTNEVVLKRAVESIQELYTTIFLVNEFDKDKVMRFTIYSQSLSLQGKTKDIADCIVRSNPMSQNLADYSIDNNEETSGVREILIVTDKAKYKGEINFAYKTLGKVLATGGSVDLSHTIIGTGTNGYPVEINLNTNSYTSIAIIAGSRSGKGVLTLSLMASMIAAGCPVVYLDFKPDMAGALWALERQVPGSRILAIDAQTNKLKGLTPVRNYKAGHGCPAQAAEGLSSEFSTIPYVKGVQLMNLVGMARVAGYMSSKKKMFFILDEAQKCAKKIVSDTKAIEALMNKNKPSGKQPESDFHKYLTKLYNMYDSTESAATTFLNTNAGSGNMTALLLGQQTDASEWTGPFQFLMKKAPIKFLGSETKGGKYGLDAKTNGIDLLGTGYFGLVKGNIPDPDNTKMIKTTLVLNEADFDASSWNGSDYVAGEYSGSLLKNIEDSDVKNSIIENDMIVSKDNEIALSAGYQVGQTNQLVGFEGLIRYIGSMSNNFNLADALSAGYNEVEKVLTKLGILGKDAPYSNVEEYMYSGKEDSLFTSNQLANALNYGMTIYDFIEKGVNGATDNNSRPDKEGDLLNLGASSGESSSNTSTTSSAMPNISTAPDERHATSSPRGMTLEEINRKAASIPLVKTRELMALNNDIEVEWRYYANTWGRKVESGSFNYSSKAEEKGTIWGAAIAFSTLLYLTKKGGNPEGLSDFNRIKQIYKERLDATSDNGIKYLYMIALGMLRDYETGALGIDEIPSDTKLRQYIGLSQQPEPQQQASTISGAAVTSQTFNTGASHEAVVEEEEPTIEFGDYNEPTPQQSQQTQQPQQNVQQTSQNASTLSAEEELKRQRLEEEFLRKKAEAEAASKRIAEQNKGFDEEPFPVRACFSVGRDGLYHFNVDASKNIVRLYPDDFATAVQNTKTSRFTKKLFESRNGTAYELKQRWDFVLKVAKSMFDGKIMLVKEFSITGGLIRVNGKQLYPDGVVGGSYGIELRDIVRIKDTLKTFPYLKVLTVDKDILQILLTEYGETAEDVWKMFQQNKHLESLVVELSNGERLQFNRRTFAATANQLNKLLGIEQAALQIEQIAAIKNPRLHEKGAGTRYRLFHAGSKAGKSLLQSSLSNLTDKDPQIGRAFGYSVLAGGIMLGVSLVSLPVLGFNTAKDLVNKFR
jgi:hypothetical protein